jgi:UDP:flavonoid glycosyltransferase YjiC (YdhE family)
MPDWVFHFAGGEAGSAALDRLNNLHVHGFIPYDRYMPRYAAAITHAGTGITYECIKAGVPVLVWPQDYDQHDNAARVAHAGLGLRFRSHPEQVAADLRRLLSDDRIRTRGRAFQQAAGRYDPYTAVVSALTGVTSRGPT